MYLSSLYVQQNSPDVAFSQSNPKEGTQYACASDHRRLLPSFVYGWPAPLSAVSQPHTSFSRRALNFGSDLPWCCLTLMICGSPMTTTKSISYSGITLSLVLFSFFLTRENLLACKLPF
ncbi:hypothetical protein Bca4012_065988 [Brassica carinata]